MEKTTKSVLSWGAALLLAVSLAGCSSETLDSNNAAPPKMDDAREWVLGINDWQNTGCSGTVTFTAAGDWAKSENQLIQGEDASLGAICNNDLRGLQDSLLEDPDNPALVTPARKSLESGDTLQAFMSSFFVNGACLDLPATKVSGQPGLICEYDNGQGNNYIQAATLIDGNLVLVDGMTTGDDTSDIKSAILSVSISLN